MRINIKVFFSMLAASFLLGACSSSSDGPTPPPFSTDPVELDKLPNVVTADGLVFAATSNYIAANGTDEVTFAVTLNSSYKTQEAKFYRYDEESGKSVRLESNKFSTTTPGDYVFYVAVGSKQTSPSKTPLVVRAMKGIPSLPADPEADNCTFAHRSMVFQFTGITCGYCPNAIAGLKDFFATDVSASSELLAVHSYSVSDPMYCDEGNKFATFNGVSSYPTVIYNLDKNLKAGGVGPEGFQDMLTTAAKRQSATAASGIAVAASHDSESGLISVHCMVKTKELSALSLYVCLVEDGVNMPQVNAAGIDESKYDLYTHNAALRAMMPATATGEVLAKGRDTSKVSQYEYCCEFKASKLINDDVSKARIIVFTTDANRLVENSTAVKINESTPYKY